MTIMKTQLQTQKGNLPILQANENQEQENMKFGQLGLICGGSQNTMI